MQSSGGTMQRSGTELENTVFQKARSREDYLNYVTKLILHCKSECSSDRAVRYNAQVKNYFCFRYEE